jgi:tRNA wybutosine-synthesizing protein 3
MQWKAVKTRLMNNLQMAKDLKLIDPEVVEYVDLVNSVDGFATSSSCYGRIILIDVPTGSKKDSKFLKKWHRTIEFDEFWGALNEIDGSKVWLKMDPLILHVSARNCKLADRFLKVKTRAGIKRGGIFNIKENRIQIELEGTMKMEVPIKYDGQVLITEEYGKLLVEEANKRMRNNANQWEKFKQEFIKEFSNELDLES